LLTHNGITIFTFLLTQVFFSSYSKARFSNNNLLKAAAVHAVQVDENSNQLNSLELL